MVQNPRNHIPKLVVESVPELVLHLRIFITVRNKVRKIASILFLLLGLSPLLLTFVFSIKEKQLRERMEEKMEEGQLQTIQVPENKVMWMGKHEIWINGSMFDIASSKLENGIYTFNGMYDEEEALLMAEEKETEEEESKHQKMLAQLFKSFPACYNLLTENLALQSAQHEYSSLLSTNPVSPFREIQTPPPQA